MRSPTLQESSELPNIRTQRDNFKSPYFNGYILKDPNEEKFILGLVASKKLGNAVERNRSKRRVREAIRTCSLIDTLQGVRFVLILKKTILKVPFIDLKQDIEKFLSHEK